MSKVEGEALSTGSRIAKGINFTIWPGASLTVPTCLLFFWGFQWIMLAIVTHFLVAIVLLFLGHSIFERFF